MARVSKEQTQQNRELLLDAAGRLFREHGIDGIGVADLSKAAGMTHGALYSRFGSKDSLAAEAFAHGHEQSESRMDDEIGSRPSLEQIIAFYVSPRQRDNLANCCPMLASASEATRQSDALRTEFATAYRRLSNKIEAAIDVPTEETQKSRLIAAAMIGIVAVARALSSVDPQGSDDLLSSAPSILSGIAAP
ncbi:TetR family transcriptional regulator [Methylobacterium sp. C25]|uniref:TetR/AcrR family transcriptional regulator n=1 Tax=Methylobacterium sp. C25 TaxID=2721622 RepID=UPI001F161DFA|nr:TetR family transcriptional regulator [Methylobacterium sp. C25]MCE4225439.1 TetR family transcriptional regulator [Methylobacterium sp. C25]